MKYTVVIYTMFNRYYRADIDNLIKRITLGRKTVRIETEEELDRINKTSFPYYAFINVIGDLSDVQTSLEKLRKICSQDTRIIIIYYNYLWEPVLKIASLLGLRSKKQEQNWLVLDDIENLLHLSHFETIQKGQRFLLPVYIPFISDVINKYIAKLPLLNKLCLTNYIVARPVQIPQMQHYTVSVIVPARNEAGNIKKLLQTLPYMGKWMEVIFVEGHSKDNTWEIIQEELHEARIMNYELGMGNKKEGDMRNLLSLRANSAVGLGFVDKLRKGKRELERSGIPEGFPEQFGLPNPSKKPFARSIKDGIRAYQQPGIGKADAVRLGVKHAKGDIVLILDSDLSVQPKELPKFYTALAQGLGEFGNGSRLVYPVEKESMRFLNKLGNKFFSIMFSWILKQRFTDTLCGTKAFFRKDYHSIQKLRSYFGDFDPFGDYELIFGAVKLNLKVVEIPINYKARTYGTSNISRFIHGWLLMKMCWFAFWKFKME